MAKLPYMQFYPADYQADVRCLSMATRGAWMEILCVLWRAPKRGQRTLSLPEWSRELGCPESEVSLYLTDLAHHKVGKISRELLENVEQITISSKRIMREKMKQMLALKRKRKQRDTSMSRAGHAFVTALSHQSHAEESESESELELREKKEETTLSSSPKPELDDGSRGGVISTRNYRAEAREVLEFLNAKTGKHFRPVETTIAAIAARLKGQSVETAVDVQTCKSLIAKKARDWLPDDKMRVFLRPETLFNRTKFESYLGEVST